MSLSGIMALGLLLFFACIGHTQIYWSVQVLGGGTETAYLDDMDRCAGWSFHVPSWVTHIRPSRSTPNLGLKCVDCADFVVNGSFFGNAVQPVLDLIPNIRTRNCDVAKPGSGIKMTTCPANPTNSDKVYKCGSYRGAITVVIPVLPDVPVHVVDRECILVYEGLRAGCHKQNNVPQDAATFQTVLRRLDDIGALKFKGQLCITDDTSGSDKARPVSLLSMLMYLLIINGFHQ